MVESTDIPKKCETELSNKINKFEIREVVELEALRVISANVGSYREHLEKQFENFKWCVGAVCVFATIILGFLIGTTYFDIPNIVKTEVRNKLTDEQFFNRIKENVTEQTDEALRAANGKIKVQIDKQVDDSLQKGITDRLAQATETKIKEIKETSPTEIIKNALLPIGTVLPYIGRLSCEEGIEEAVLKKADDNMLPMWPQANREWLVCNGCTLMPGQYNESLPDSNRQSEGLQLPDLRGQFMRGASSILARGLREGGESHQHSIHLSVDTSQPVGPEPFAHVPDKPNQEQVAGYTHQHNFSWSGLTESSSNIPPCTNLVFIVRVK